MTVIWIYMTIEMSALHREVVSRLYLDAYHGIYPQGRQTRHSGPPEKEVEK